MWSNATSMQHCDNINHQNVLAIHVWTLAMFKLQLRSTALTGILLEIYLQCCINMNLIL